MDVDELFHQARVRPGWAHDFVVESNKIDPQEASDGFWYTSHFDALVYAVRMASADRYALPKTIHEILLRGHPREDLAGKLRYQPARVGINSCLPATLVPSFMWGWGRRVHDTVDSLRTDDGGIEEEERVANVWDLHCEFENIHPFELFNGKVGRILMVNHALLLDLNPWSIPCEKREDYFDMIRYHPSAKWGATPPETYDAHTEV